jgi:glycosyltransferase 2 family protein
LYFLMVYLCFFSIPETAVLGPAAGFAVMVLGSIGVMVTPGGIGLYPAIVAETLKAYGIGFNYGLALGWISWAAQALMIIIVGSISLFLLGLGKKKNELSS